MVIDTRGGKAPSGLLFSCFLPCRLLVLCEPRGLRWRGQRLLGFFKGPLFFSQLLFSTSGGSASFLYMLSFFQQALSLRWKNKDKQSWWVDLKSVGERFFEGPWCEKSNYDARDSSRCLKGEEWYSVLLVEVVVVVTVVQHLVLDWFTWTDLPGLGIIYVFSSRRRRPWFLVVLMTPFAGY